MMYRSSRNKHFLTLATVFGLLMLGPDLAAAAGPRIDQDPGRDIQVERTVELEPTADAEVVIPGFKAFFLSDGSVTISGKGTARVGAPIHGFDFEVDLVSGTYRTRRLDPREIEERKPLQEAFGENRQVEPQEGKLKQITAAVTPGTFFGRVRVQTKDPAFIVLTETTTQMTWTVNGNGTVAWNNYSDGCWAANPSSLGTHWFVSYCQHGSPWYPSSVRVCNDNRGNYYNWDFGDNTQRTDASQWSWMCGRNDAIYDYNWSHNDSGEFSLLIYGSLVVG